MDAIILLSMIFAVIIYVMVRGSVEEKRNRKQYEAGLREGYGKFPDKEYSEQDFENITRLFAYRHKDYFIDDIVYNPEHPYIRPLTAFLERSLGLNSYNRFPKVRQIHFPNGFWTALLK